MSTSGQKPLTPGQFSFSDIRQATDDFSHVVGEGGEGTVYKGFLPVDAVGGTAGSGSNGKGRKPVAVKRLKPQNSLQFREEIETLSLLNHSNLVSLLGYCQDSGESILVYDYMHNGSLSDFLYKAGTAPSCSWELRLCICIDAARGLEYLHTGTTLPKGIIHRDVKPGKREEDGIPLSWETRLRIAIGAARGIAGIHSEPGWKLVHGNVKSSNVFLNPQGYGCVADVGLSTIMSSVAPTMARMAAYPAPEATDTGKASQPSDMFSFGVLLLELLTGKSPVHTLAGGDEALHLIQFVQTIVRENRTANINEGMAETLQIALSCIAWEPEQRPKMAEVVRMLEGVRGGTSS